jgi:DNA-binding MarR family transcriptional regulator
MVAFANISFDIEPVKSHHRAQERAAAGDDVTETLDIDGPVAAPELFRRERLATTEALHDASALVGAAVEKLAVVPSGLDPATADLLVRLARGPSCGIRGVDIGAQCQMTATRVSRLLDRAEADGLVQRLPDPSDRRAQHVVLTADGRAAATRLAPLLQQVNDELVRETLSTAERATLIELLGRLTARARELVNHD